MMETLVFEIARNTWMLFSEAAPWLLFGLLVAGLIKAFVPEQRMAAWLGGGGLWPVSKAALLGAPLPLCSCSVIPVAIGLHRAGASRASTTAFLVSAPETGVDSVAASYALLGPFLTVVRPLAAIVSALVTGLLSNLAPAARGSREVAPPSCAASARPTSSGVKACCASGPVNPGQAALVEPADACCGASRDASDARPTETCCAARPAATAATLPAVERIKAGLHYAVMQIFNEFAPWLAIGLVLAGITITLVPPAALAAYGSGLPAMLLLLAVSVPLYVCATESTPIATALLAAGVSPGAVLVFLMAGPATNIATIGALRKEFGGAFVAVYLASVAGCAIGFGLVTNIAANWLAVAIVPAFHEAAHWAAWGWIELVCAVALLLLAVAPLRRRLTPHSAL